MKTTQDRGSKLVDSILKEMFKRVGLKYPNPSFTKDKEWYTKKTWSEKEEESFRKWMKKRVKKTYPYLTDKRLDFEVAMFDLMYGWKTERKEKSCPT